MILVCGGAGYIGSHAVRQLIDKGEEVIIVDNLETGHEDAIHPKAKFYKVDIRDEKSLNKVFEENKIDEVIHFAANSLVGESMTNPLKYFNNNVHGTEVLLKVMVAHDVKNIPILESDETNPTNAYGETKLCMEKMMKWADKAHGVKYISLRYFNVAGAHVSGEIGEDHNPETHLIPLILQVPLGKREFISIFGDDYETHDGTCIRDYIHVTDLADAHILAVHKLREGSESNIYNLGSGNGFTVKEMIEAARKVTEHEIPAKVCERRAGDPAKLVASSEKARRELGWNPKYENVEDMISSAWNWHKNHPNGFEK